MILSFHPCFTADHQIIPGSREINDEDRFLADKADVILLPQTCPLSLYKICKHGSALLFPNYDQRFRFPGKVGQARLFKELDCPYPETFIWPSVEAFREAFFESKKKFHHEMPFLIKADIGHEAKGVSLIGGRDDLVKALEHLLVLERSGFPGFISQELIPSAGNVLRVVIMGEKLIDYWKRPVNRNQIITTAGGGALIDSEWRQDLREKGRAAAREFSSRAGINLAAIDFVFPLGDENPQPLFLEINYYFGRRGLGGSENYYRMLFKVIRSWLGEKGFDPEVVEFV